MEAVTYGSPPRLGSSARRRLLTTPRILGRAVHGGDPAGGERTLVERLALEEESKARGRRLGYVIQGRRTDNPITKKDIIPFKSHRKIQIALHNESYKRKRFNDISEPRPKARKIAFRPGILGGKHNAITFSRIL